LTIRYNSKMKLKNKSQSLKMNHQKKLTSKVYLPSFHRESELDHSLVKNCPVSIEDVYLYDRKFGIKQVNYEEKKLVFVSNKNFKQFQDHVSSGFHIPIVHMAQTSLDSKFIVDYAIDQSSGLVNLKWVSCTNEIDWQKMIHDYDRVLAESPRAFLRIRLLVHVDDSHLLEDCTYSIEGGSSLIDDFNAIMDTIQ